MINCTAVPTTPAINLCHGFSVISSVIDTSDKFITGVIDTAEQLSPVTMTLAINLSPVSTILVNKKHQRVDSGEQFMAGVTVKFFTGFVDTGDKTVLPILCCLHLKMKNKQKFNL